MPSLGRSSHLFSDTMRTCSIGVVFDKIHLISVTMGTCLIGICIDYSFHYLSEYAFCKDKWDSSVGLKHILPGISLGFITTTIGYTIFFFIPFTGLKQIAVFTIAGLAGAYLTVVLLFPLLFKKKIIVEIRIGTSNSLY